MHCNPQLFLLGAMLISSGLRAQTADQALARATAAVDAACSQAKEQGVRAARLRVSGAFHTPAMGTAAPELQAALDKIDLNEARVPVYSGVTAAPFDDARARLVEGLTSPVRWRETVLAMRDRGATRFLEVGPGRVLTGLVRKTLDGVEAEVVSEEPARA